jgi:O-antigen ligase
LFIRTGGQFVSPERDKSVASRIYLWQDAIKYVRRSPLIGSGYGAFADNYIKDPRLLEMRNPQVVAEPKDIYLNIILEWGIIGFGLFLFAVFRILSLSMHLAQSSASPAADTAFRAVGVMSSIALMVAGLFDNPLFGSPASLPCTAIFCVFAGLLARKQLQT